MLHTRPYFHGQLFGNIEGLISMYGDGATKPKPGQRYDLLVPKADIHSRKLSLVKLEKEALRLSLGAMTTAACK